MKTLNKQIELTKIRANVPNYRAVNDIMDRKLTLLAH